MARLSQGAGEMRTAGGAGQFAAMAALRWQIFVNGLRSKMGALEFGMRTVGNVLYAGFGLLAGSVVGVSAYVIVHEGRLAFLPIVFWAVCVLWQMVPVVLASLQEQFDLSILLRFPVSFRSYFLLYAGFGLWDVSTILGALCCLGIWVGITVAQPGLSAWTALILVALGLFNALLARAIFAWIDRWLSQRKTREIVGALFMLLLLSLQLFNPALHRRSHSTPQERIESYRRMTAGFLPWLKTARQVQALLPPGLAARSIEESSAAQPLQASGTIGLLGLYALAAGGLLAWRLRAEYRGESLGQGPRRAKPVLAQSKLRVRAHDQHEGSGLLGGPAPIAAVAEKELRALVRTLPLLWALGVPVLMVLVLASVFRNSSSGGLSQFPFSLPLCVAYALLGFTQLFYNNLGSEGAGIQLLFLSPTPIRTVLLAKNLFHAALFCLDALAAAIVTTLRLGPTESAMAAATVAWLLFALPCNLGAGNILSLTMPYRINPGRISRQRGSQANALISLLVELGVMGVGAGVLALCWYLDDVWLAVPIFLVLAGGALFGWLRVLGNVDEIANRHKDALIATLMKAG